MLTSLININVLGKSDILAKLNETFVKDYKHTYCTPYYDRKRKKITYLAV